MFGKKKRYKKDIEYLVSLCAHAYLTVWEFSEEVVEQNNENAEHVLDSYYSMLGVARFIAYKYDKPIEQIVTDTNEEYLKDFLHKTDKDYALKIEWF